MAATELGPKAGQRLRRALRWLARWRARRAPGVPARASRASRASQMAGPVATLVGGVLAGGVAHGVTLPEDEAEAMVHVYHGGGITASGPAVLVRKSVADRVSLSGSYYVDMVSNASIDVVTTASPYKETRHQVDVGADYAYRDALITLGTSQSTEPDYKAASTSLDIAQETFGGMTTVSLGFTRGADNVGRKGVGFFDYAKHWQYRLGLTQILTPRWLASANFEAISDDGFLGSPYRVARVFGAAVPERDPRTRSSRALKLRAIGDIGEGANHSSMRVEYRYFWDNWAIKAHTLEVGGTRHVGEQWLADASLRLYQQSHALFYSDNAASETLYVSRNRQLSTFNSVSFGAKLSKTVARVQGRYEVKAHVDYQLMSFHFKDFTDIRTGSPYSFNANVLQLLLSATF